jgi:hypothetical protein
MFFTSVAKPNPIPTIPGKWSMTHVCSIPSWINLHILISPGLERRIRESLESAFQMAQDGYTMIDNAQGNKGDGDEARANNEGVKRIGKVLFGDEKNVWDRLEDVWSIKGESILGRFGERCLFRS